MNKAFRFVVLPLAILAEVGALVGWRFWMKSMPDMYVYGFVSGMLLILACYAVIGDNR